MSKEKSPLSRRVHLQLRAEDENVKIATAYALTHDVTIAAFWNMAMTYYIERNFTKERKTQLLNLYDKMPEEQKRQHKQGKKPKIDF